MLETLRNIVAGLVMLGFAGNAAAIIIGVGQGPFGSNAGVITTWLTSQGHTANIINPNVAANFVGLDVYLSIRDGLGSSPFFPVPAPIVNNVSNFVQNGGGLVTEWSGTDIMMQMFGGTSIGNNGVGTGTTVVITQAHPVTNGVSNFASSTQTEFNWQTNIAGTGLSSLGTIAGQDTILVGSFGTGRAVGLAFDWQDAPWNGLTGSGSTDLNTLILNSLAWADGGGRPVPAPATGALLLIGLAGMVLRRRRTD